MRTIAIVGGGISGLALGEALQHRARTSGQPIRTVIFEEGPAIGGKISTIIEDGFVIETGPHPKRWHLRHRADLLLDRQLLGHRLRPDLL